MQIKTISILLLSFIHFSVFAQKSKMDTITGRKLSDAIVYGLGKDKFKAKALDVNEIENSFLNANRSNSLMSTLDKIPGVGSMQVGQGQSKPVIRGLGFNRVAVLQNGIKQQGQQWGADHGLEIDQYDVDRIQIYKGAMSLQLGSDAIAGALIIPNPTLKDTDGHQIDVLMNGATNNRLFGGSIAGAFQKDKNYIRVRTTYQNAEDYRVPTDKFEYLGYVFPIHKHILKNTAGREFDASVQAGHIGELSSSRLLISNVYSKTGFFAGAHGIPTLVDLEDDGHYRRIGLPYQRVNHFKVIYNQEYKISHAWNLNADLGYQNNNRREYSLPHTHGHGEVPETNLELELKLQTFTLNPQFIYQMSESSKFLFGINAEYQVNNIGGYSFLLPKFEQFTAGIYAINTAILSPKLVATSGIRYDFGHLKVHGYTDHYLAEEYQQRAEDLDKKMGSVSFSAGLAYLMSKEWNMKVNIGRSFRMPTANELSSNGVHHGTFRHELGDKNLKPETSYQLDINTDFSKTFTRSYLSRLSVSTSAFVNYFPNFIFLNPTGKFSWLPDAGQYYQYQQSKALRAGGELSLKLGITDHLNWESSIEYVYAQDTDNNKPIPFTPPWSIINEFSAKSEKIWKLEDPQLILTHRFVNAQNRVAVNEKTTPAYNLFDISLSFRIPVQKINPQFTLQVQNILNKTYYNHLSFYRTLDIPEIGRNVRISLQFKI